MIQEVRITTIEQLMPLFFELSNHASVYYRYYLLYQTMNLRLQQFSFRYIRF